MPIFHPYTTKDIDVKETVGVSWTLIEPNGTHVVAPAMHVLTEDSVLTYSTSFISCQHPEGKCWNSLFVPVVANGMSGFSITWWGKEHRVKGQISVKQLSENEWYNTVKSKAVAKDYKVLQYIGRNIPLTSGHSFIHQIITDDSVSSLPQMAFTNYQSNEIREKGSERAVGRAVTAGLKVNTAIGHYLRVLEEKGFDLQQELIRIQDQMDNMLSRASADFVAGMYDEGLTDGEIIVNMRGKGKPAEPVIDRVEVYGNGWGGFA